MPPKAKFTKTQIAEAALRIVEQDGEAALTARSLGEELGSSARPVFTVFNGMDEVWKEVMALARSVYSAEYVAEGLKETPAFKGVGKSYIRFATERPKLFRLLFMHESEAVPALDEVLGLIEENYREIIRSVETSYGFGEETSKRLYQQMWIYTHGIAVLTATKVCAFSAEQISQMLTEVFVSLIKSYRAEGRI